MKSILTRRTIRKYADRAVSDELLNRLMTEAARTQTMGNLQLYSVIVTRNDEMKAFLSFINAATDALLYTQTLCNLMDEEGLGYCYLRTTVYQPQQIIDILQLPQLVMPVATLTVGWPAEEPTLSDRLPLESFVHQETYHDYLSMDIDTYYKYKEELEDNRHFVEINNKETLAQVFTDIRYTRKDNEAMSKELFATLVRQGFLPHTNI